jgi:hypothetical protein
MRLVILSQLLEAKVSQKYARVDRSSVISFPANRVIPRFIPLTLRKSTVLLEEDIKHRTPISLHQPTGIDCQELRPD